MRCDKGTMLLYAVTDRAWVGRQSLYEQVESALKGGVTCVQLREKTLSGSEFLAEAVMIRELCRAYQIPFIINDNVEIAIQCEADGVHVGQEDGLAADVRRRIGEKMIMGLSAHTAEEAAKAVEDGADYLGVGAVFSTSTKRDASALSRQTMEAIRKSVTVPIVAIGGINKENICRLSGSGADGVALVSAIFSAGDIEAECRELRRLSEKMVRA